MEDDPVPRVLLTHTFEHKRLSEHVDEIRFREAVLVTGVEVLELQSRSRCSSVAVLGETYPSSLAVEIFARINGEARFRQVCAAFIYSSSSEASIDIEVIVTDHIVLRGIYSAVTLAIYGTPARDLDPAPSAIRPAPAPESPEWDLVRVDRKTRSVNLARRLVPLAAASSKDRAALVNAALSCRGRQSSGVNDDAVVSTLAEVAEELETGGTEDDIEVVGTVLTWIEDDLRSKDGNSCSEDRLNKFVTGLAAAQLICSDAAGCLKFVLAGGIDVLMNAVQVHLPSTVSATAGILTWQALETSTRHAFGCDSVLGWAKQSKANYAAVLLALLQADDPTVLHKSAQVLHRLRVYELASMFQATVRDLIPEIPADPSKYLGNAFKVLNALTSVLYPKPATRLLVEFEDDGIESDKSPEDIDNHVLIILQERRLLSSIAALVAAAALCEEKIKTQVAMVAEIFETVQNIVLCFLSSRSGILFLSADPNAARIISAVLDKRCSNKLSEDCFVNYNKFSWSIDEMLQACFTAVDCFKRLADGSNDSLWNLTLLSRTQAGRRALVTILQDTETLLTIVDILSSAAASSEKLLLAAFYAAEILYAVVSDSNLSVSTTWMKHAPKLSDAVSALKAAENEVSGTGGIFSTRLQLVVEVGRVYRDKGAVELLRSAAFVAGDNSSLGNTSIVDQGDVSALLGTVNSSSVFDESTILQLTSCMTILASVCSSSLAAALFAEGAVAVVTAILGRSAFMLRDEIDNDDLAAFHCVMKLIAPALLLLSMMLHRLQLEHRKYHNSKLVTLLLKLHCTISRNTLLLPANSTESVEARAVLRILASNLACWLAFGWDPTLPMFRPNLNGSLPNPELLLDPAESCSSIILLGNLLDSDGIRSSCWHLDYDFPLELMLGPTAIIPQITWHKRTIFKDAVVEALILHQKSISEFIARLAASTSEVLRSLLVHVFARITSVIPSLSAEILRKIRINIQERMSDTGLMSNADALLVVCCTGFVMETVKFHSSKAIIIKEGTIKFLLEALAKISSVKQHEIHSCMRGLLIRISESRFSTVEQCQEIIPSFKTLIKDLPLDHKFKHLLDAFYRFSYRRLGKIAILKSYMVSTSTEDDPDSNRSEEHDEPLLGLSKRLAAAFESLNGTEPSVLLAIAHTFVVGSLRLADAGRSKLGIGALKALFGIRTDCDQVALTAIPDLIKKFDQIIVGAVESKCSCQIVDALHLLLKLLRRPVGMPDLTNVNAQAGQMQSGEQERIISGDFMTPGISVEEMFEESRDSFSWELSDEAINAATRRSKRKASILNNLSKRLRSRANSNQAIDEEKLSDDQPATNLIQSDDPEDEFDIPEPSIDDEHSPINFSSTYETELPEEFRVDDHHQATEPAIMSSGTVRQLGHQVFPSRTPFSAPPSLQSFLPSLQQHFHFQQQQQQHQSVQPPHEHYGIQHQQQRGQDQTPSHQEESWSVLQQILASPESIQDLLSDQARLTRLLEQHPKLLSLLQERFN